MEVVGTTINMNDGGGSRTDIDTSSSIGSVSSPSVNSNYEQVSTSSYQTNNTGNTYDIEEVDLSLEEEASVPETTQQVEEPKKGLFSRIGDWFVNTGKAIYETGAKVVKDVKTWCSENLLGPGNNLAETAANAAKNAVTIGGKLGQLAIDGFEKLTATGTVLATTITSGVTKLGEHVVDGLAWCGGKIVEGGSWLVGKVAGLFGAKEAEKDIIDWGKQADKDVKEFIAVDWVGEANKWFYEKTEVGRYINEKSMMKYDSEAAKKIMNISEKAAEIAAATALTIFTGGAATFAVGALVGLGKSAESTYQQNGTDTTLLQEGMIALSGGVTGLSWYATGKLGKGFIEIGKTASTLGGKEVVHQLVKEVVSKNFWKKALKEGLTGWNGVGNYAASAMMTGEKVLPYIRGDKPFTAEAAWDLAKSYVWALGLNVAEDALRGYVTNFKMSDDNAIKLAEKILDPDDAAKLSDYTNLSDESVRKLTDLLSGEELADQLKGLDDKNVQRVLGFLDDTQKIGLGATLGAGLSSGDTDMSKILALGDDVITGSAVSKIQGDDLLKTIRQLDDDGAAKMVSLLDDAQKADLGLDIGVKVLDGDMDLNDLAKLGDQTVISSALGAYSGEEMASKLLAIDETNATKIAGCLDEAQKVELGLTIGTKIEAGELNLNDLVKINDQKVIESAVKGMTTEELAHHILDIGDGAKTADRVRTTTRVMMSLEKEERLALIFEQEKQLANGRFVSTFTSYREHAELHTRAVQRYAEKLGKNISDLTEDELAEISLASYFHDLGMAGGVYKDKDLGWMETLKGGKARSNHPLNSAIAVIQYDLAPEGTDPERIALLAMSHSKSTSGIKHMSDPDEWRSCVDKLDEALQYSRGEGMDPVAKARLYQLIEDPDEFAKLQKQAMCIRDGDAMSEIITNDLGDTIMQTGRTVHIEVEPLPSADVTPPVYTIPDSNVDASFIGADKISDTIVETGEPIESRMSKIIHAGEDNVRFDSTIDNSGTIYHATSTIVDPLKSPEANIYAINERIGEVITYDNLSGRGYTIKIPVDGDTKLAGWYTDAVDTIKDGLTGSKGSTFTDNLKGILTGDGAEDKAKQIRTMIIAAQQAGDKGQLAEIVNGLGLSAEDSAKAMRRCTEFFNELDFIEHGIQVVFN